MGAVVYVLFFSPFMIISKIEAFGALTIGDSAIEKKIIAEMEKKYFSFLKKNNFILFSKKRIVNALKDEFIKIDTVEIVKKFPDKIRVSVKEKRITFVLCGGESCFAIDDAGLAYAPADFEGNRLGENELPIIRDESKKIINQGSEALAVDYAEFVLDIRDKLQNELNIDLEREIHTPNIASGDIRMMTREGWRIMLDNNIPAAKEIEMLRVTLNKIDAEKRKDLDYIDLRINNKVFYKFKTQENIEIKQEEIKSEDGDKKEKSVKKKK